MNTRTEVVTEGPHKRHLGQPTPAKYTQKKKRKNVLVQSAAFGIE